MRARPGYLEVDIDARPWVQPTHEFDGADMSLVAQYVAAFTRGDSKGLRSLFTADALVQGVLASASLDLALGVWWVMTRIFVEALVPNAWPKCPYNLAVASI